MSSIRIGHGYDVHAFTDGDGFVLGGVHISCAKAVVAHSDGDVLIHALCDALLGALGRGDIGQLFPDNDAQNENRDSREFLREIKQLIDSDSYHLGNADLTIVAQTPKMAAHIAAMKHNLAQDLGCETSSINVKATTTEGLGFIGQEQGIAVAAVVLLEHGLR
jgi:2-C-methyl-D-erythritol 2,4-cyclodiphosphate synthase